MIKFPEALVKIADSIPAQTYLFAISKQTTCNSTLRWHHFSIIYIHELVVRARQLASVAQLVRALHRSCKVTGSIFTANL